MIFCKTWKRVLLIFFSWLYTFSGLTTISSILLYLQSDYPELYTILPLEAFVWEIKGFLVATLISWSKACSIGCVFGEIADNFSRTVWTSSKFYRTMRSLWGRALSSCNISWLGGSTNKYRITYWHLAAFSTKGIALTILHDTGPENYWISLLLDMDVFRL